MKTMGRNVVFRVAVLILLGLGSFAIAKEATEFGPPVLPVIPTPDHVVWVAPDGDDLAVGTEDAPLATFAGSVAMVRKIRESDPEGSVTVFFRGGRYPVTETILIDSIDATAAHPVLFTSAPGEKAVFTGGCPVGGREGEARWVPLTESEIWKNATPEEKKRFDADAVDRILVASLADLGIEDFGNPGAYGKRAEFFYDGVPQTLARWPNEGFAVAGKALGESKRESWAHNGSAEGIFEGAPDQPRDWENEKDAYLFGYWFWDWAESFQKLKSLDPETGVIETEPPYHPYGFKDGLRYYGFNLLCELNVPGEYFIDAGKKVLYWIPPCPEFQDFAEPRGSLVRFEKPFMVEIKDSSHVILANLEFNEARGNGIHVEGGSDVLLAHLTLARIGQDAVHINGGERHGIYDSTFMTLGCGGIEISGGDRKTLTPADHFVENCVVKDFSRIKRTYAPAVLAKGCGMRFAHNHFTGSSSSAMRLEGNDFLVEFCQFDHLVDESDDQGGIDVYYNPSYRGNVIRWNRWEDIVGGTMCGAAAIRFDDIICGYQVIGNIFVRCGAVNFGAIQIHGGKDNLVQNNVFIDSWAAVSFTSWGEERYKETLAKEEIRKKIYEEVDIRSEVWQARYPELTDLAGNPNRNWVKNNLLINCENDFLRDPGVNQIEGTSSLSMVNPTAHLSEILRPEFLAGYGLAPIPYEKIGLEESRFILP